MQFSFGCILGCDDLYATIPGGSCAISLRVVSASVLAIILGLVLVFCEIEFVRSAEFSGGSEWCWGGFQVAFVF